MRPGEDARQAARELRRLPAGIQDAVDRSRVLQTVAARLAASYTGPWAPVLRHATTVRTSTPPAIVIGGDRPLVSGGATGRDLAPSALGKPRTATTTVTRRLRRGGSSRYAARTGVQFARNRPARRLPDLIDEQVDTALDGVLDAVDHATRSLDA